MIKKTCKTCGEVFNKNKNCSLKSWVNVKFCSRKCKRHTDMSKYKNMISHIGKKHNVEKRLIDCVVCSKRIELKSSYYVDIHKTCKSKECISVMRKKSADDFHKQNPDFSKVLSNKWIGSKNPNWSGGIKKSYRVRKYQANGEHSKGEWENLKTIYGNMCLCCKRQEPEIKLTEDHIVPLIKGGSDFIENIQPLCITCNKIKARKIINYKKLDITLT